MLGFDMSLWKRVTYPNRKNLMYQLRDTAIVSLIVGVCTILVTESISKIVEISSSIQNK